jgi:aspartate aminotransferase
MSVPDRIRKGIASGSLVRKMFDEGIIYKKRYGEENVFDLSLGNPIAEPPPQFKDELLRLAQNTASGLHRYMENAGYAATRAAVAAQISRESGLAFSENEIVMTCGAAAAINVVMRTILSPGDEVILFAPYFAEYLHYIWHHDGVVRIVPTDACFLPNLDELNAAVGKKTRAVIMNSPNNPSGAVYPENIVRGITDLLQQKQARYGTQIVLISDEAYRRLIYDGLQHTLVWNYYPESIVCTSYSKDLSLPGERIGYIAVHPGLTDKRELMDGMIFANRTLGFVNAPALMQRIVRNLQGISVDIMQYQKKRDFLYDNLVRLGYSVFQPQGAFYIFPKTMNADDTAFVRELQQEKVLTVPGSGFGTPGYFRICFSVDDRTLAGSLEGFRKVAGHYHK